LTASPSNGLGEVSGAWPAHPVIYELSTLPWLNEIADRVGRPVTLDDVPAAEWDAVAHPGVDAVWLMGVWERSPAGRAIALGDHALRQEVDELLPDATEADIVASPYCVRNYRVDPEFGGPEGLSVARAELAARGVRLLLDFVPNHVAPDHDWVTAHPEYFVRGTEADLGSEPPAFLKTAAGVIALGRDPYFAPWPDVVQLDPTQPALRAAVIETLSDIANQCDGVRCDMAMLQLDDVVVQTWGDRVGPTSAVPYWRELTEAVRLPHPNFLFVAEAYWDREGDLITQGFDHCYDKRLYDRLVSDGADSVRDHLAAAPEYQRHLVRFLENHDEPRAAAVFPADRGEAAAVMVATVPGALLLFQGQFAGRRYHFPVQLGRWPAEPPNVALEGEWRRLLELLAAEAWRSGRWSALEVSGWPDNDSCRNLLAWQWEGEHYRHLIVMNFSDVSADGLVHLEGTTGDDWNLTDLLDGQSYQRVGAEMDATTGQGLYVSRGPFGTHLFRLARIVNADRAASSSDLE
jgi:glycosidase